MEVRDVSVYIKDKSGGIYLAEIHLTDNGWHDVTMYGNRLDTSLPHHLAVYSVARGAVASFTVVNTFLEAVNLIRKCSRLGEVESVTILPPQDFLSAIKNEGEVIVTEWFV